MEAPHYLQQAYPLFSSIQEMGIELRCPYYGIRVWNNTFYFHHPISVWRWRTALKKKCLRKGYRDKRKQSRWKGNVGDETRQNMDDKQKWSCDRNGAVLCVSQRVPIVCVHNTSPGIARLRWARLWIFGRNISPPSLATLPRCSLRSVTDFGCG